MNDVETYLKLKNKLEDAQQQRDKAQGALEEVQNQLKEKFGCKSLKDAKLKLKEMEEELKEIRNKRDKKITKFEEEWPEELEE